MGKLIVLDYSDSSVHIYDVQSHIDVNEEYIEELGFHTSSCSWMYSEDMSIHFHKRKLL